MLVLIGFSTSTLTMKLSPRQETDTVCRARRGSSSIALRDRTPQMPDTVFSFLKIFPPLEHLRWKHHKELHVNG